MTMSRKVSYRYELLNKDNLKIGDLDMITGTIDCQADAKIKKSGSFQISESRFKDIDYLNDRICPYMIIDDVSYPLGVFLISGKNRQKRNGSIYRNIEAFDLTQILLEDRTTDRYYVSKGTSYYLLIRQLIESANIFNTQIVYTDLKVQRDREFELGTPKIDIINALLEEINYTNIYVNERGFISAKPYIIPTLREIQHQYIIGKNLKVQKDSLKEELDIFDVPNVYVGVVSNSEQATLKSKYINDNPASPMSTVSRNRNIVKVVDVNDIANGEVLNGYIKRVAYEESNAYSVINFDTLNEPDHSFGDCIYIKEPSFNLGHKYIETGWSMELKAGSIMSHTARRIVIL